jgi:hypothetical protein
VEAAAKELAAALAVVLVAAASAAVDAAAEAAVEAAEAEVESSTFHLEKLAKPRLQLFVLNMASLTLVQRLSTRFNLSKR